jgi:hypothetical protein
MVKATLSLCLIKHYAMNEYGGIQVQFLAFITSSVGGCEPSVSRSGPFTSNEIDPKYLFHGRLASPQGRERCGKDVSTSPWN